MTSRLAQAAALIESGRWDEAMALASAAQREPVDEPSGLSLSRFRHVLLAVTLRYPLDTLARLEHYTKTWDQPAGPVVDALSLQCMDANWRAHGAELRPARRDWLRDHVHFSSSRFGAMPSSTLWRGCLELLGGDRGSAYASFRSAAELSSAFGGLARMFVGAYSIRPFAEIHRWADALPPGWPVGVRARLEWKAVPAGGSSEPIIFYGCDTNYFKAFAPDVIADLQRKESSVDTHFHVVGWDDECAGVLRAVAASHRGAVSVTTEACRYPRDRTYFATVRFLRANAVLRHSGRPLYITDIDNRFLVAPERRLPRLAAIDAGFRVVPSGSMFPWWSPAGGNLFLNCTAGGMRVAELLEHYVRAYFRPNQHPRSWWFDQLALNETLSFVQDRLPGIVVEDLADGAYDLSEMRPPAEVAARKAVKPVAAAA